jgi:hypothetical protein
MHETSYCCFIVSLFTTVGYPDGQVLLACKLCSTTDGAENVFSSKTQLAFHLENFHSDLKAWKCGQCSYQCMYLEMNLL